MDPEDNNRNMNCDCKRFVEELLTIFADEVSKPWEYQYLWEKLVQFLRKYSRQICDANNIPVESCSQKLCFTILKILEKNCVILYPIISLPMLIPLESQNHHQEKWWSEIKLVTVMCNVIGFKYFLEQQRFDFQDVSERCVMYDDDWLLFIKPASRYNENMRALTALEGKSVYMKLLVNLGLLVRLDKYNPDLIIDGLVSVLSEFLSQTIPEFREVRRKVGRIINMAIKLFFRENVPEMFFYIRMYLTMIAVRAVQLKLINKEKNTAEEYIYSLRMYFSITRDPYLMLNEVRSMLYACFFVLEKLDLFEKFYEEFLKFMPECSAISEPCSLTDLARFQIRKNLKKYHMPLPAAVAKLNIPEPLKKFVLGNVIQMSRKSRNVSTEKVIARSHLDELAQQIIQSEDSANPVD